jgi:hypothetical protein
MLVFEINFLVESCKSGSRICCMGSGFTGYSNPFQEKEQILKKKGGKVYRYWVLSNVVCE